jgi:hypothetical protein
VGGLRIGKPLKERGANEPIDESLEWDRDGQYFHYLTKWMHALCRAAFLVATRLDGRLSSGRRHLKDLPAGPLLARSWASTGK